MNAKASNKALPPLSVTDSDSKSADEVAAAVKIIATHLTTADREKLYYMIKGFEFGAASVSVK